MKRIIAAVLSLLLVLSLCGCGSKEADYVCISQTSYAADGTITAAYTYDYNENGDLIRSLYEDYYNDPYTTETTATYGTIGQPLEQVQIFSQGSTTRTTTTVYNYNDESDTVPTSCKSYDEDGSVTSTGTYEYDTSTGKVYFTECSATSGDVLLEAEFQYLQKIPTRGRIWNNFFPHFRLMSETIYIPGGSTRIRHEYEWNDNAYITTSTTAFLDENTPSDNEESTYTYIHTYEYNEEDLPIKETQSLDGESIYTEYEYALLSDYLKGN